MKTMLKHVRSKLRAIVRLSRKTIRVVRRFIRASSFRKNKLRIISLTFILFREI